MDLAVLAIFIPTFFFVSITPGMCMTLAMTLGMSVGVRRTMYMMVGELLGVAIVAVAAVIGVASVMLKYPDIFAVLKYIGGGYLGYLGVQMSLSKGKMAIELDSEVETGKFQLFAQGLITAISNPKGWGFMIALLPPFINTDYPMAPQMLILLSVILLSEFICMTLYATGGKTLRIFLSTGNNVKLMNQISGTLMIGVGIWLAIG
ncbi:LysE family translocator [Thalassotalea eurytherma]|uniref:Threonine transporter RhtB n=1 Tax=Thalassotalea eurytherma TaxID=1144278 RepID=A0ABQ6H3W7_9GAMM|nr:LysE family translocator [Thalassotalea eurytherma]GLX82297.1 threonine transporter RhtB [Thalassotalea eurytherma]